jgi:hypothetical protein
MAVLPGSCLHTQPYTLLGLLLADVADSG